MRSLRQWASRADFDAGASGRVTAAAAVTAETSLAGRGSKGLRATAKPGRGRLVVAAMGTAVGGSASDLAAEALATAGSSALQLADSAQAPVAMDYASSWTPDEEQAFLEGLQVCGRCALLMLCIQR